MAISKMQSNIIKVTGILGFIAVVLVATLELRVQDHIGDILDWIEDHKVAGSISFVGLYALFTGELLQKAEQQSRSRAPLLHVQRPAPHNLRTYSSITKNAAVIPVPASVMSLAAGAIFKLPLGSLLVWIGAVVGEIGCFIIGRCALLPLGQSHLLGEVSWLIKPEGWS